MNCFIEALCNVHSHLREIGETLEDLILMAIQGGADVVLPMPNTTEGLMTLEQVLNYIENCESKIPPGRKIHFIPTGMLTENTPEERIMAFAKYGILNCKGFPRDRTTKSQNGIRDYGRIVSKVQVCGEAGVKVHLHPEHPWMAFSSRDAEYCFLPIADMLLRQTNAIIIWEHGSDARCIPFLKEMATSGRFFVTLSAHHLASNEDQGFGDTRSVCKPPLRTEFDRLAYVRLVEENHSWIMAGGDDAPHAVEAKHVHSGQCASGAYAGPFLIQLYAHALDNLLQSGEAGRQVFINFTSRNARALHNLPEVPRPIQLERKDFIVPNFYQIGHWKVEPFWAGRKIKYSQKAATP